MTRRLSPSGSLWRRLLLTAGVLVAAGLIAPAATASATETDAELAERKKALQAQLARDREERDAVQAQLLTSLGELDVVEADLAVVLKALTDLDNLVTEQRADVDATELELAAAQASVDAISARLTDLAVRQEELLGRIGDLIVQNYIGSDAASAGSFGLARTGDIYQAARIQTLVGVALGDLGTTSDELHSLTVDAERAQEELAAAVTYQEQRVAEAQDQLAQLLETVAQQEQLRAEVEERYERRLYEAESIRELDAEAADAVATSEQALIDLVSEQRRREAERKRKLEAERRRRLEEQRLAELRRQQAQLPSGPVDSDELVWVGGIRVHESIAVDLRALLDAAARADIVLGGGGYRSNAQQIYLRRAHCGTSDWAIYKQPSYTCRPPTARPGSSMHELGLAVDFTHNGRAVTSRNSAAFKWLAANAGDYGLKNLPSEPWHWSINGR